MALAAELPSESLGDADAAAGNTVMDGLKELARDLVEQLGQLDAHCITTADKVAQGMVTSVKHLALEVTKLAARGACSIQHKVSAGQGSDEHKLAELQQRLVVASSGMEAESRRADFWVQRAESLNQEVARLRNAERETLGSATALKLRGLLSGGVAESPEEQCLLEWLRATEARAFQAEAERDHATQQLSVVEKELIEKMTRDTSDLRTKLDTALEEVSEQRRQLEQQQRKFADERATFWEELEASRQLKELEAVRSHEDSHETMKPLSEELDGTKCPRVLRAVSSGTSDNVCREAHCVSRPVVILTHEASASGSIEAPIKRLHSVERQVSRRHSGNSLVSLGADAQVQARAPKQSRPGSHTVPSASAPPPAVVSPRLSPRARASEPWAIVKQLSVQSPPEVRRDSLRVQSPRPTDSAKVDCLMSRAIAASARSPKVSGSLLTQQSSNKVSAPRASSVEVPSQRGSNVSPVMVAAALSPRQPPRDRTVGGPYPLTATVVAPAVATTPRGPSDGRDCRSISGSAHMPPAVVMTPTSARIVQRPGSLGVPIMASKTPPGRLLGANPLRPSATPPA